MKSFGSTQEIRLFMGFPAIEDLCRELTGAGCSSAKAFQVHSGRKSSSRLWICEIDESLAEVSCSIFTVLRMLWSVGLKKSGAMTCPTVPVSCSLSVVTTIFSVLRMFCLLVC